MMVKEGNLISLEEFIKRAKSRGINFGKSDPYNRLRYYTKLSMLPHMERRKVGLALKSYYPASALDRFIRVEELKSSGLTNDEILKKLKKEESTLKHSLKQFLTSRYLVGAGVLVVLVLVLLHTQGLITLGKENTRISSISRNGAPWLPIVDSGTSTIRAGKKKTFVKSKEVAENSQINVTFKNSYSPATTFWVESKVAGEGFILALDDISSSSSSFSWWVVQN